jgi:UDP-N-acetylglucosamine--N-acetylmuramyl-(pentapeptide) pyrophosphoryl-undecaprenol N-acetylglucosamine transferase
MKPKILIAAGGTGGHLFPAQQLCSELQRNGGAEFLFAGYKLEASSFFDTENISYQEIPSAPLKKLLPFLKASSKGFWQSVRLIRSFQPDVVVGFGSYHSFPVLLAAAILRKKIVLFEANCILGKVNRLFLPLATKIAFQFPQQKKKTRKGVFVPLLPWVQQKEIKCYACSEAKRAYGLDPELLTILVFGGSQGAQFLNREFPKALQILQARGHVFQVIHLTGKEGENPEGLYKKYDVAASIKPFETNMALAYSAADVVVCRSGASTMAELIRLQKRALLIPYPYAADDHQRINAQVLRDKVGTMRMLLQPEASPKKMADEVEKLFLCREVQKNHFFQENRIDFAELVRSVAGEKR